MFMLNKLVKSSKTPGQSESKKQAKRSTNGGGQPETKGTAMSFGFKKKLLYSTASKKTDAKNQLERLQNLAADEANNRHHHAANASAPTTSTSTSSTSTQSDDNGNTADVISLDSPGSLNESKDSAGRTTPRLTPPRKESSGAPYRSIRFGFRQANAVRPASTGLNPTVANYDNVSNNNINVKPRSKSATTPTRSIASQPQQQQHATIHIKANKSLTPPPTTTAKTPPHTNNTSASRHPKISPVSTTVNISYQSQARAPNQSAYSTTASACSSEMSQRPLGDCSNKPPSGKPPHPHQHLYTNDIIRPTPQTPSVSSLVTKFTLHTASLPKPQFPVPITLASPSPVEPTPPTDVHPPVMDTKFAKQTANTNRRGGTTGFRGPRDISNDSGISNMCNYHGSSSVEHSSSYDSPPRRSHSRPRNFEMIMSSRHKFDVRQLDDSLSDESSVVPLSLPKLPSVFSSSGHSQPAPLSGLIRSQQQQESPVQTDDEANSVTFNFRKSSYTSLDVDSTEEEKEFRDKSTSEKNSRPRTVMSNKQYSPGSKTSSPQSSRASWCNAGESMALKDCSSMSVSSCDSMNKLEKTMSGDDDVDNFSSPVISSIGQNFITPTMSALNEPPIVRSQIGRSDGEPAQNKERALFIDIGRTFAQITADVDDIFLDDETSPTDSMVSSTDSDEIISKRNKKKINDAIKEKDIDELELASVPPLPLDLCSPLLSPGTPTHASRSFSLSDDGGRDFLIDDEIADQPALCFSQGHDLAASTQHLNSLTDTPTLTISSRHSKLHTSGNYHTPTNNNSYAPQAKPRQSLISRTESLGTLSPCESIASDDMMMDFDSSVDSIDRLCQSMHGDSTSALHSMDGQMLWSELEAQGEKVMGEWSTLLRGTKPSSRDAMIMNSPIGARRVKTDLRTETMLVHSAQFGSRGGAQHHPSSAVPPSASGAPVSPPFSLHHRPAASFSGSASTSAVGVAGGAASAGCGGAARTTTGLASAHSPVFRRAAMSSSSAPSGQQRSMKGNRSQLPARATRLLNRSRVQHPGGPAEPGADSPRSLDSFSRNKTPTSTRPSPHPRHLLNSASPASNHNQSSTSLHGSDDNIFMLDKSMRNIMIQDVLQFKKELLRLRSILQEPEEECLTRTDTLNPFETSNGQFFGTGALNTNAALVDALLLEGSGVDGQSIGSNQLDNNKDLYNLSASHEETRIELADLRRQVVYLQSQMDDKDRTIRIQQTLIDKLETEIDRVNMEAGRSDSMTPSIEQVDTTNTATQTERMRPLSMAGQDGSSSDCNESDELLHSPTSSNTTKSTPPTLKRQPAAQRLSAQSPSKPSPRSIIPLLNQSCNQRAISPTHKLPTPITSDPHTSKRATTCPPAATGVDFQHSTPKTSPTIGSPRRIPRLVKQANLQTPIDLPVIPAPTYPNGISHQRRIDENIHQMNGDHQHTSKSQHLPSNQNVSTNAKHFTHPPSSKSISNNHNQSHNPSIIHQYHSATLSAVDANSSVDPEMDHVKLRNKLKILRSPVLRC